MPNFLAVGDGVNTPRKEQVEYLTHLAEVWDTKRIFGAELPPGIGKSMIARTIQRTIPNTAILTINNALVDQYTASYPTLNGLKGRDYYDSDTDFKIARQRATIEDTVFNPLSFYYFYLRQPQLTKPTTVVIDEAHKLGQMLLLTVGQSFECDRYQIPPNLTDQEFYIWISQLCERLGKVYDLPETARRKNLMSIYETFHLIQKYLSEHLEHVKVFYEMRADYKGKEKLHLTIQPLRMPIGLMKTIFGEKTRVIMLSGTLTELHLRRLYPNEIDLIDMVQLPPVAPRESRIVHSVSVQGASRQDLRPLADAIRTTYNNRGRPNTLVHVSYTASKGLVPLLKDLKPIVVTSKDDKAAKLAEFKAKGGILIGSGMAEGVDLPGDLCRLIIIPRLLYPNRGEQAVKKDLALPDGELFYGLDTLLTTVQMLGRGVRGKDDWCESYILDPTWYRLVHLHKRWLTQGFLDALKFNSQLPNS